LALGLFLYNLSVGAYKLFIHLAATLGNKKAQLWVEGRKNIFNQIKGKLDAQKPKAWFHCASLGEFEQARPVLEEFRKQKPDYQIILTFFSPSGYEVRKNYDQADIICYLPSDTAQNALKFLEAIQPNIIFWTKYEFWYHYLRQAHQQQIPVILFSAIFRKNQLFFKFYGGFYKKILSFFRHIFVQDKDSLELLQAQGIQNVAVAFDTRFDRVFQIASQAQELELVAQFKNNQPTLVVGSLWQEDWEVIRGFLDGFQEPLKLIIAPHEISEKTIQMLQKELKSKTLLFSEITNVQNLSEYNNLIINNVGYLSALYRYGDFAFVGGGFKQGLHNILEPATFGMPVLFGNKAHQKFREAQELLKLKGAFEVGNSEEFTLYFSKLYSDKNYWLQTAQITKNYIQGNIGGTSKVLELALKHL